MRGCARLTRRPRRLALRAAPHGLFSKRVTKPRGCQQQALNACWALSSRHAHARSLWNMSRKNRLVSMVGAGDSNSDLPFACPTPSQAPPAPRHATARARRNALGSCARRCGDRSCLCTKRCQVARMDVVLDPTWTIVSGRDGECARSRECVG